MKPMPINQKAGVQQSQGQNSNVNNFEKKEGSSTPLKDFLAPQPKQANKKGRIQSFYSSNAISFSSISLLSSNQVRYLPDSSVGTFQRRQRYQKGQNAVDGSGNNSFGSSNLTRSYRLGELPDIEIKYKDLLSPMILICLNDEELASDFFSLLFIGLYSSELQESIKLKAKELLESVVGEGESASVVKSFLEIVRELERKGKGGFKGEQVVRVAERTGVVDRMVTVVEEIVARGEQEQMQGEKRIHTVEFRGNEEWGAMIQAYKLLGEHANINAIVQEKLGMKKDVSEALELQMEGEMVKARKMFKQIIERESDCGGQKEVVDYLEKQNKECLAALGMWEELEIGIKSNYAREFQIAAVQQIPERDLEYYLIACFNQLGKWNTMTNELTGWMQTNASAKNYLESRFAYEISLMQITVNDLDRAKYYINIEEEEFMKRWSELTSSAATWKHHLAQRLQKIQELKEFLQLAQEKEIKQKQLNEVLGKWQSRVPGVESSIANVHELIQSRVLFSIWLQEHFSLDQQVFKREQMKWLVSAAGKMMNKGYLDVAAQQIKSALKLKRDGFVWEVIKVSAKLKFFEIQRSVKGIEDLRIAEKSYGEIKKVLEKTRTRQELPPLQELKSKRLELQCDEHFFHFIDNNLIEGVMNKSRSVWESFMNNTCAISKNYDNILKQLENLQLIKEKELKFQRSTTQQYANFAEKLLRILEGLDPKFQSEIQIKQNDFSLISIAQIFFNFTIKSLKLGVNDHSLVLKLIDVVQKYSQQLGQKFQAESNTLPSQLFLKWLPQMMYLLSGPISEYFGPLFLKIANEHPQDISYHLNSSYSQNRDITPVVKQLYGIIQQKFPLFDKFLNALRSLMHPEQRLQQFLEELKDNVNEIIKGADQEQGKSKIIKLQSNMENELFDSSEDKCLGQYNLKFNSDWHKQIVKLFSSLDNGQQLTPAKCQELQKKIQQLIQKIPKISTPPSTPVTHFTTFFTKYSDRLPEILIPSTHIPLSNISSTFETLSSIRKPKHLGLFSKSQKRYEFLIKGGEDLRLDQRILQLFSEMECGLVLFKVIACDQRIGVVEWMQKTKTLRSIIENEVSLQYNSEWDIMDKNPVFSERLDWLKKRSKTNDIVSMHTALLTADEKDIVPAFSLQKELGPKSVLITHLDRISRNQEQFLQIRSQFIKHIANIGIAGYMLGIGDRHLENFLINSATAELIAIDFGYSFGQGVTLHLPELMPFRLTKVFLDVLAPVGVNGAFREKMVNTLKKIRTKANVLLDCSEVFVKDPLLDVKILWVKQAKKTNAMSSSSLSFDQGSQIQHSLSEETQIQFQEIIWYPRKKIEIMKRKLLGHKPTDIMIEELKDNRHLKPSQVISLQQVIRGNPFTLRANKTYQKEVLTVEEQIDILIDLSKDENILARTWIGWAPYI